MVDSDVKLLDGQVKIQGATIIEGDLKITGKVNGLKTNTLEAGESYLGKLMVISGDAVAVTGHNWVALSGTQVIINSADLILDNKEIQENSNENSKNIALSHVRKNILSGDKLVINNGEGYKGGVEIEGAVNIKKIMTIGSPQAVISLPNSHPQRVVITPNEIQIKNVKTESTPQNPSTGPSLSTQKYIDINLVQEILELKKEISELKKKLATLESEVA